VAYVCPSGLACRPLTSALFALRLYVMKPTAAADWEWDRSGVVYLWVHTIHEWGIRSLNA
jgi:hypothetical protein